MNPEITQIRSVVMKVRLTPEEAARWKTAAAVDGQSVADWVRKRVGGAAQRKAGRRESGELIRQLAALGNNLNQIARRLNRGERALTQLAELANIRSALSSLAEHARDVD